MATYKKYVYKPGNDPDNPIFYYYINNTEGFYYYFNEKMLRNVAVRDICDSEKKFKDDIEPVYFDSCKEMFNDFQNVFKSFNPNSKLKIYVIIPKEEDKPEIIILVGSYNIVLKYDEMRFAEEYPYSYLDQLLDEPEECGYFQYYDDINAALDDPALMNYRDVLDSF